MKKQEFKTLKHREALRVLGGITDPNLDPDAGYVAPVKNPDPSDDPTDPPNDEPDPTPPSRN
jgi:hypothetical protein